MDGGRLAKRISDKEEEWLDYEEKEEKKKGNWRKKSPSKKAGEEY